MGEIRSVGTGETHGYPYLVCKKRNVSTGDPHRYHQGLCKPKMFRRLHVSDSPSRLCFFVKVSMLYSLKTGFAAQTATAIIRN